ncbi:MAG: CAAX prenyl protease-related protein [Nitrospiraceae bacterium]|nr:CAAX prenyl protease-related protein [Nitrospiraceae bacterium]
MLARILPFIIYMSFVGVEELLHLMTENGLLSVTSDQMLYLYPVKISLVILSLVWFRKSYTELNVTDLKNSSASLLSIITGLVVFVLWINMDWGFATFGDPKGYDPMEITDSSSRFFMISTRLIGAALVVPIMEEIFWRSFAVRYIINPEFQKVAVGAFTPAAFIISVVLFGLEHNYFLAGMMAGAAYNLILYRSKSIAQCVLSHAVTNLALGIYVLCSSNWKFW